MSVDLIEGYREVFDISEEVQWAEVTDLIQGSRELRCYEIKLLESAVLHILKLSDYGPRYRIVEV